MQHFFRWTDFEGCFDARWVERQRSRYYAVDVVDRVGVDGRIVVYPDDLFLIGSFGL